MLSDYQLTAVSMTYLPAVNSINDRNLTLHNIYSSIYYFKLNYPTISLVGVYIHKCHEDIHSDTEQLSSHANIYFVGRSNLQQVPQDTTTYVKFLPFLEKLLTDKS